MKKAEGSPVYVGMGWILCDHVMMMPSYPREDEKVVATKSLKQVGGPAVRALMTIRNFGAEARFVGAVGDDSIGRRVTAELRDSREIDVSLVVTDRGVGTRETQVWLAGDSGSRTIAYSPAGPELRKSVPSSVLLGAQALVLDGRHAATAVELARTARERGIFVAVDLGSYKDVFVEMAGLTDLMVGPEATWATLSQEAGFSSTRAFMLGMEDITCVMTHGDGPIVCTSGQEEMLYEPKRVAAIDSNGAGDVFFGAMVWGLTHRWDMDRAVVFATTASALKCQRIGNLGIPRLEEILELIGP